MSSILDNFKEKFKKNTKTKLGFSFLALIIISIIIGWISNIQTRIAWHVILTGLILGFYWSWRKGGSLMGLSIDAKIMGGFTVLYLTMCVLIFKSANSENKECPSNCKYDDIEESCINETTNVKCSSDPSGEFFTTRALLVYFFITVGIIMTVEMFYFSGNKKIIGSVLFSFIFIFVISWSMLNIILSAGGDPRESISNDTERLLKQSDLIFKGGIQSFGDIISPSILKLKYEGDPTKVKIVNLNDEDNEGENIYCSYKNEDNKDNQKNLWQCANEDYNRIENKCGGDWLITSDKGCLKDTFTELYRYIFVILTVSLVFMSVYSLKYNSNMYTLSSMKPLLFTFGLIILYHIVYLIFNMAVSWTFKEAFLFQDFFSEVLKSGDGVWFKNDYCDNIISQKYNSSEDGDKVRMDKGHKSIWENDSTSMKVKLILNIILSFIVIGYIGVYVGNKYIFKLIPGGLSENSRKVYFILTTALSVLIGLQGFYWFISTIIVDQCVIERISENSHKIKNKYQKFCKSKVKGASDCEIYDTRKKCLDNTDCDYDNSFTYQELIRCQLDSHGGLLFHFVLMLIPMIGFLLFNTRITELFK